MKFWVFVALVCGCFTIPHVSASTPGSGVSLASDAALWFRDSTAEIRFNQTGSGNMEFTTGLAAGDVSLSGGLVNNVNVTDLLLRVMSLEASGSPASQLAVALHYDCSSDPCVCVPGYMAAGNGLCSPIACPNLAVADSDTAAQAGSTGDTWLVTCADGHHGSISMVQTFTATCQGVDNLSSAWTTETCVKSACSPLTVALSDTAAHAGAVTGDTKLVTCDDGHSGSSSTSSQTWTATCTGDGGSITSSWSVETCVPTLCPAMGASGVLRDNTCTAGQAHGATCQTDCENTSGQTYTISVAATTYTCAATGGSYMSSWQGGSDPTCIQDFYDAWTTMTATTTGGEQGASGVFPDGKIVFMSAYTGGYTSPVIFDPVTDSVSAHPAGLPAGRINPIGEVLNGRMYYGFGGTGSTGVNVDMWSWGTGEGSWTSETVAGANAHRCTSCSCSNTATDTMWLVNGYGSGGAVNQFYEPTKTWSTLSNWPGSDGEDTLAEWNNGKLYCMGIQNVEAPNGVVLRILDVAGNTWSLGPQAPSNRGWSKGGFFLDRYLYIFQNQYYNSAIRYDVTLNTWSTMAQATPDNRNSYALEFYNGYFYLITGTNGGTSILQYRP